MAVCQPIPSSHLSSKAFTSKAFTPNPSILGYGPELDSLSMQAFWKSQKPNRSSSLRKAGLQAGMKRRAEVELPSSDKARTVAEQDHSIPENWAGLRHYPSGYSHSYSAFPDHDDIAAAPVSKRIKIAASEGTLRLPTIADREAVGLTLGNLEFVDKDLGSAWKMRLRDEMKKSRTSGREVGEQSFVYAIEKQYSREGVVVSKTVLKERIKRSSTGSLHIQVVDEFLFWIWEGLVEEAGRDRAAESWLGSIGR